MAEYETAQGGERDSEYGRYRAEIDLYEKEYKPWESRGKKVIKLYKDADNARGTKKRFNILWSNVETLKPALYARDPEPVAERRFKDADPVGRTASEVLERCIAYTLDCQGFGHVMRQVVSDRLLPGRGVCWFRYHPTLGDSYDDEPESDGDAPDEPQETQLTDDASQELLYEQVIPDYVYWEDFGHNIARTWEEVWLVWRKVYMTRAKLVKRFGEVGQTIPLDYTPKGLKDEKYGDDVKKACIYEAWDKEAGKVCFLSKSHPKIIEAADDPLGLTNGFPCPRPLFGTMTTDSLCPTPDYALYQTQAQELEELTARICALQKALKLAGVYDSSAPELARLLNEGYENKLVPVDNWATLSEKGGLDGAMDFLPIKEVAETLIALHESREKAKQDLYEITGIADIIRGNSEPNETATAQQIKGRFAVLRISDSQDEVQRFARDGVRIIGEIIAEHFDLETIKAISGIKLLTAEEKQQIQQQMQQAAMMQQMAQQQGGQPQQQAPQPPPIPPEIQELMDQPTWEEVHELIQHQVLREFRIDIETDSTIRTDEEADRAERTEFITAAGAYLERAVQAVQQAPELGPLMAEILMFGVRSHRAARSLEPVFEDAMKQMQQPKPPRPDPEMAKVEAEKELKQQEMQMESQAAQQKMQLEVQTEQQKQQAQHEEELARQQMEDQRAERESQRQMQMEQFKADLEARVQREKVQIETEAQKEIERFKVESNERIAQMQAQAQERAAANSNGDART